MSTTSPNRLPSLDGLRAISICLVLVSHLIGTRNFIVPENVNEWIDLGALGVRVFFVISGFLITNLLLAELAKNDSIDLIKFYFRRTFRLFPAYYLFICVVILLEVFGWIQLAPNDVMHAVTYTSNYYDERSWYLAHTWSLSVEEQFYLLWPAALLLTDRRRGLWLAGALLVVCPLIRILMWEFSASSVDGVGHGFETIADSIAIGCLLAGTRDWLKRQAVYNRLLESKFFVLAPVVVLLASMLFNRPRISFLFGCTVMNVGIALCLDWCITYHAGKVGRLLNSKPLVFLGMMSYSIYLWQQLFLNRYSSSPLCAFPLNILLVAIMASASYYLVEGPTLQLRQKLEARLFARRKRLSVEAIRST